MSYKCKTCSRLCKSKKGLSQHTNKSSICYSEYMLSHGFKFTNALYPISMKTSNVLPQKRQIVATLVQKSPDQSIFELDSASPSCNPVDEAENLLSLDEASSQSSYENTNSTEEEDEPCNASIRDDYLNYALKHNKQIGFTTYERESIEL